MRDFDFPKYLGIALNLLIIGSLLSIGAYLLLPWRGSWFVASVFVLSLIWSAYPKSTTSFFVGIIFALPVMAFVFVLISSVAALFMLLVVLITIGIPAGIGFGIYSLIRSLFGIKVVAMLIGTVVASATLIGIQVWTILARSWNRMAKAWTRSLEWAVDFWWDEVCERVVSLLTFWMRPGLEKK